MEADIVGIIIGVLLIWATIKLFGGEDPFDEGYL